MPGCVLRCRGSPRAECTGCHWVRTWELLWQTVAPGMQGDGPVVGPQPSSGAPALLQGKKQQADFTRPGHAIPAPGPSHLHPMHHTSLPLQPHGHHSVLATVTSFLVATSAPTLNALGPVSHTPARASCPEDKLHSISPMLPSRHDPSAESPAPPLST